MDNDIVSSCQSLIKTIDDIYVIFTKISPKLLRLPDRYMATGSFWLAIPSLKRINEYNVIQHKLKASIIRVLILNHKV